jgi:hypothetical protein
MPDEWWWKMRAAIVRCDIAEIGIVGEALVFELYAVGDWSTLW